LDAAPERIADCPAGVFGIFGVFGRESTHFLRIGDPEQIGICKLVLQAFALPDFSAMGLVESRENLSISAPAVAARLACNREHPPGSLGRDPNGIERRKALPGPRHDADAGLRLR
jgi:hypothetical protein